MRHIERTSRRGTVRLLGWFALTVGMYAITTDSQAQWVEQGPGPDTVPGSSGYTEVSGAVQAIAADPSNSNRVFIGTVNGGVWRTDNATAQHPTWFPLTDQMPSLSIQCIALSPLDPSHNTVFAGIGGTSRNDPNNGINRGPLVGLLKTTDGGNSWVVLGTNYFAASQVYRVLPSLTSIQTVFVTTGVGLFRSDDGGQTWNKKSLGINGLPDSVFIVDIAQDPGYPQRLFAAIKYPSPQVFRSDDVGDHWTNLTGVLNLANNNSAPIKLAISPSADALGVHWVYLLVNNGAGPVLSKDNGASWTRMDPLPSMADPELIELVSSPNNVNIVFAMSNADPGHYRGDANATAGAQWTTLDTRSSQPHTDGRDWVFSADPRLMFECDDGGIYRLKNPMSSSFSWNSAIGNLRVTEFASVAYDSVNHIIFGACPDNSIPQQTTPGAIAWGANEAFDADGFESGVDNTSIPGVSVHYSSQQHLAEFRRRRYTNPTTVISDVVTPPIINGTGGLTLDFEGNLNGSIPGGIAGSTIRWNQTWAVNRVDGKRLLMGTAFLYESSDRADTFSSLWGIGQNAGGNPIPLNPIGFVTCYAYGHILNTNVFYVGTRDTPTVARHLLWLRSSGSSLPVAIDSYQNQSPGPGGSIPFGIAMDPSDWHWVYVADSQGRVWRTTDAGASWSNITGPSGGSSSLSSFTTDLRTIEVDNPTGTPGQGAVIVGGLGGVFYTPNPGASTPVWSRLGSNLPNAIVTDLHYYPSDDLLLVGTFGRGAWTLPQAHASLSGTWVDFFYGGPEFGTFSQPYNTLGEGIAAVPPGGILNIKAGSTSDSRTINNAMTIKAYGGVVTIGR